MCKYSYVSGACANRRVESIHCIGEKNCDFSGNNILGPSLGIDAADDPLAEEWHRLYCETHGRYLCNRKEACPPQRSANRMGVSYRQRRLVDDGRGIW